MGIKATAFWSDHGQGFLQEETLADPRPDELVVQTLYTGISKGTETLVYRGQVPVSEHERMRAPFQVGDFSGAVKYGYCNVGRVIAGPSDWVGERVFCLYPHQDVYVVAMDQVHRLPNTLPSRRAVLAANMETAVNGIADAGLDTEINGGQTTEVTIVGAGVVGCLLAHQARRHGHAVELIDINAARERIAQALGVEFRVPDKASKDRPVVLHTSATEAGLQCALNLAGQEGLVVEMSWFGDRAIALPLGEAFHARRLTLKSSQVGHISPARQASWTHASRFHCALDALSDATLDALLTHQSTLAELPEVMHAMAQGSSQALCHVIAYGESELINF